MNTFKALSIRTRLMVVASGLFLLTLSLGLMVFGQEGLTSENSALEQLHNTVQADMLYPHVTTGGGH